MIDFKRELEIMKADDVDMICLVADVLLFVILEAGAFFIKDFPVLDMNIYVLIIPGIFFLTGIVAMLFAIMAGIVNRVHNLFSYRKKHIEGLPAAVFSLIVAITIVVRYLIFAR